MSENDDTNAGTQTKNLRGGVHQSPLVSDVTAIAIVCFPLATFAFVWTYVAGMPFDVALFPRISAVGIALGSAALLLQRALRRKRSLADHLPGAGGEQQAATPTNQPDATAPVGHIWTVPAIGVRINSRAVTVVLLTIAYIVALPYIGFILSSTALMIVGMIAFGNRSILQMVTITALFVTGAYELFFNVLYLQELLPWFLQ